MNLEQNNGLEISKMTEGRTLNGHKVDPATDDLDIVVMDGAGDGGASHRYLVVGFDWLPPPDESSLGCVDIRFQNGPIAEKGVNGLTQEILLEICADRLRGFQSGAFACRENAIALTKIEEAQMWLQKRTRARMGRGVEGTHEL